MKKRMHRTQWRKEKKKKKRWSKVAAKVWQWILPCSVIYGNVIKLWFMETKNTLNVFSVFITHNSKIRELSDGNKVMVVPNGLVAMGPNIFELWVIETENWVMEKSHPTPPKALLLEVAWVFYMAFWVSHDLMDWQMELNGLVDDKCVARLCKNKLC